MTKRLRSQIEKTIVLACTLQEETSQHALNGEQRRYIEKIQQSGVHMLEHCDEIDTAAEPIALARLQGELRDMALLTLGYAELLNLQLIGQLAPGQIETVERLCEVAFNTRSETDRLIDELRWQSFPVA